MPEDLPTVSEAVLITLSKLFILFRGPGLSSEILDKPKHDKPQCFLPTLEDLLNETFSIPFKAFHIVTLPQILPTIEEKKGVRAKGGGKREGGIAGKRDIKMRRKAGEQDSGRRRKAG